jgi:hypothetical protein
MRLSVRRLFGRLLLGRCSRRFGLEIDGFRGDALQTGFEVRQHGSLTLIAALSQARYEVLEAETLIQEELLIPSAQELQ